jgi:hypothetical protein
VEEEAAAALVKIIALEALAAPVGTMQEAAGAVMNIIMVALAAPVETAPIMSLI